MREEGDGQSVLYFTEVCSAGGWLLEDYCQMAQVREAPRHIITCAVAEPGRDV